MYIQINKMKKIYSLLTFIALFLGSLSSPLFSQCANNNDLLTFASVPTIVGASSGAQLGCIYPGEFVRFSGFQAGSTYRISACGSSAGLDTRLSIYPSSGGASVGFNDDFCGLASRIDFTPTTTGSYDVLLDETGLGNTCISNTNLCGQIIITLIGTGAGLGYCTPTYTAGTSGDDFINGVSLGTINNQNTGSTSGPAYTFYSNLSTSLNFNTNYTISIRNNPTFQERVAAWIDYNGDNTFTSDERLGQIILSPNQLGTINFTTPATGAAGATRLRVRQVFTIPSGSFIDPCGSATLGETEDYVIVLPSDPQGPQIGDSFSTTCGLGNVIPDNACPNYSNTSVSVSGLADLGTTKELKSVEVIIEHEMAADLDLFLESPTGVVVLLSSDNGGSGANYGAYSLGDCSQTALFRMNATTAIAGSTAPFIGSFIPEGNLNDFNTNINPNGIWKLRACDDFAGDIGTVQLFKLNFGDVVSEVPSCASNFNIANGATNQATNATLSWSAGSGSPTSYDVYFGTDANPPLISNNQGGTTFNPGTLTPSETYFYSIVPSNATGDATGCEIRSFTVVAPASGILMSNGIVSACAGNFFDSGTDLSNYSNDESLTLTINPSSVASAVQVDFSTFVLADGDQLTVYDGSDVNASSLGVFTSSNIPNILTATNIEGSLTFEFVSDNILNAAGWQASITCVPLSLVPGCVSNLAPSSNATGVDINANISWSAGTGNPTSYDVFFGTTANPPLAGSVAVASFEPGELLPSTTYFYRIAPINANGANASCIISSFTTAAVVSTSITIADADQTICSAVFTDTGDLIGDYQNDEDQTITFTPDVAGNLISVTFNQLSLEDGHDFLTVYNGNSTSAPELAILTGNITTPVTFLSDAVNGALTFQFISDFQNTDSGWNATISCIPNTTVPPCAINLAPANQATNQSVNGGFAWESGGGAPIGYDLFVGTAANDLVLVANDIAETEFQPLTAFAANTTYFWQVVPANQNGSSTGCPVNSFTTVASQTNDVIITNGQATVCSGIFTDSGGQTGPYSNNETFIFTLFPATSGSVVQLDFTQFDLDPISVDGMIIIDGSDPFFGNVIGVFSGTTAPTTITSSAPDGALTVIFTSDATLTANGWAATISCVDANAAPLCLLDLFPASGSIDQSLTTELTWNPNTQGGIPTAYDVYFGTDFLDLTLVSDNQSGTSFSPTGLVSGTQYFWQIVPSNAIGEATFCSISNFTTGQPVVVVDILMTNGSLTTCAANFYDMGGPTGSYDDDADQTFTITPSTPNSAIQVTFNSFNTEATYDGIYVYDGPDINSPLISSGNPAGDIDGPLSQPGAFWGTGIPGPFTSTHPSGALTFVFKSDVSGVRVGWDADVICVSTAEPATCANALFPADLSTEVSTTANLSWTAGSGITVGYDVFFGTDPDALVQVTADITTTSFDLPVLDPSTTYYYQIVPYNNVGSAVDCPVNSFITTSSIDIIMADAITVNTCAANFYDMGGPAGNYNSSVNQTLTITPSNANSAIQVTFNSFNTEATWDGLYVYNGPDINSPLISSGNLAGNGPLTLPGAFWGTSIPGPFTSTHPSGALTFVFKSDGGGVRAGWDADVICLSTTAPATCATALSPADLSTEVSTAANLSWSAGSGITVGYNIFFGTDPDALVQIGTDVIATTFDLPTLDPSTTYYYQIVPYNNVGSAVGCSVSSFTTSGSIDIIMADAITVNTCAANFYDMGGPAGNYNSSVNQTLTITPSNANSAIQVTFNSFDTEATWDGLYVYNGPDINSPLISSGNLAGNGPLTLPGAFWGTSIPGPFTSTHPSGALTFVFRSDGSGVRAGWDADVVCVSTAEPATCATALSPADLATDVLTSVNLSWSAGTGITTSYDVYFGTSANSMTLVSDNQTGTTYTPSLAVGTTYFWTVVPSNSVGAATECDTLSFTVLNQLVYCPATHGAPATMNCTSTTQEFISNVTFGLINNPSACVPAPAYSDFTSLSTNVIQGESVPISFLITNRFSSNRVIVWADWNQDGDFDDAGELSATILAPVPLPASPALFSGNVNVPAGASLGATRMRVRLFFGTPTAFAPCGVPSNGWGETEDYTVVVEALAEAPSCATNLVPADLATEVNSANTVLSWTNGGGAATYDVFFGTDPDALVLVSDNQTGTTFNPGALEISSTYYWQVVPSNSIGTNNSCAVTSFVTSGSVDIIMADGISVTTCAANFYDMGGPAGNYANSVNQTLTIIPSTPNSALQVTFNSFNTEATWDGLYVYDGPDINSPLISSGNPAGNGPLAALPGAFWGTSIPGPFTSTHLSGALTFVFRSDGSGVRVGWDADVICINPSDPPSCVTFTSGPLDGDTGICVNETGFAWISGTGSPASSYDVYFDLGGGLQLLSPAQTATSFDPGLLAPNTTYSYQVIPSNDNGSAVDCPIITFTTGTCLSYCDATTTDCDEFIENVTFGSVNNTTDCSDVDDGYADFTNLSSEVFIGSSLPISITNGNPFTSDQCGIWVDWNQDGDFGDANETIAPVAGSPGVGPYSANITPPFDAIVGPTRMRVRITWTGALLPCGNTAFGEVEDYTIIVAPALACPFPNNITLSETSTTTTVVSWDAQPSAIQYLLRYKLVSEPITAATWTSPQQIDAPLIFSFIEGLLPCEDYELQIASICDDSGFPPPPGGGLSVDTVYSSSILFGTRCVECTPEMTLENETCPADANGTCLTAQPISCGETICASTFIIGTNNTRDVDWYSFTVPTSGLYTVNISSEFLGLVQIANVDDCANPVVISQGSYEASSTFTLASTLNAGNYALLFAPEINQTIDCEGFNQYTVTLSGSNAEIAPVDPICETTAPFNLFAIPSGGTWSGTGITSTSNGTFDPSVAGIGSFIITYNSTANGCASSDTVTIVVSGSTNTAPAQPTGTDSLCINAPSTVYTVTPINGISSYVWVLTPTEAGTITGTTTSATVVWSPTFTGTASVVVAANSSCGLSEFSTSLNIEVAPIASTPTAIQGLVTSCSVSDVYSVDPTQGSTTQWTISPSSSATLISNGNSVTVNWTNGFIGSATLSAVNTNFCGSSSAQTLAINVLGSPFADFVGLAASYCTSEEPAILTGIPSGGYFVSDPTGAVTGNVFNPSTVAAGTYSISYTVEVDGCLGTNTQSVDVISGAPATLSITPATVCNNSAEIDLTGTATPSGGVFGGLGVVNGVFFPSQVTPGPITITYTIQGGAGECPGFASQVVQVNPSPVINLVGLASSYCLNSEPVVLEGFPALGTFSGPGVTTGVFTPLSAGLGNHVLTYSFDNGTCIGQDQVSVEVTPNISVNFAGVPSTICSNANVITLSSSPSGAVFSGPGVSGNKFDPKQAGVGAHTITANLTQGTCVATSTTVINVVPSPIASFNYSQNGATVTMINSSVNATSWNWAFGDGGTSTSENPSHTYVANGNFVITLIASGSNINCNADTLTVPISLSVGIGSIDGMDMVQLFPNPTNGDVNLSLNSLNAQSFEIRITDATGRLIANEATTNFLGKFNRVYDLSDKAKGVYFFTITSEKGAMNFRIVRN